MRRAVPLLLAVALIAIGATQLRHYGATWDEALGDYFFGQRYLSFFTSFDTRYLDFDGDPYPAGTVPDLRASEFRRRPWEYWPVANVMAAATSRVVANQFGWLDPFDGFHAFNLLAGAVLLYALYRFVERARGAAAAIGATAVLFLMPRVVCDLFANIKDFPEAVFFSLTIVAFFAAYERGSTAGIVGSGAVWGLALGTKANACFLPAILGAFMLIRGWGAWRDRQRALVAALAGAAAVGVGLMFVSWPYLWPAPVGRLSFNFRYLAFRATHARPGVTINPWVAILYTTPPVVILASIAGFVSLIFDAVRREPFAAMVVAWFGVIALRISTGVTNFDGVRHFLEIFVPLAIAASIGAVAVGRAIAARAPRLAPAMTALAIVPALAAGAATLHSHPFETAYWNAFAGGLSGARERGLAQASDYWAASYREGLDWIDANVPRGSILVVPIAGHTVKLVAPVRLRADIRFVTWPRGGGDAAARERLAQTAVVAARTPLYVMFVPRRDWSTELDRDCMARLRPVKEWTLDGAPVLLIYRYLPSR